MGEGREGIKKVWGGLWERAPRGITRREAEAPVAPGAISGGSAVWRRLPAASCRQLRVAGLVLVVAVAPVPGVPGGLAGSPPPPSSVGVGAGRRPAILYSRDGITGDNLAVSRQSQEGADQCHSRPNRPTFKLDVGSGRLKKVQRVKKGHHYLWYLNPGLQCENGFWHRFCP